MFAWREALGRYFDGKSCGRGVQGSEEAAEAERKWVQLLEMTKGQGKRVLLLL